MQMSSSSVKIETKNYVYLCRSSQRVSLSSVGINRSTSDMNSYGFSPSSHLSFNVTVHCSPLRFTIRKIHFSLQSQSRNVDNRKASKRNICMYSLHTFFGTEYILKFSLASVQRYLNIHECIKSLPVNCYMLYATTPKLEYTLVKLMTSKISLSLTFMLLHSILLIGDRVCLPPPGR